MSIIEAELAARIKAARARAMLTQLELARTLGCSMRSVQDWEAAKSFPRALHRRRLATFLAEQEERAA